MGTLLFHFQSMDLTHYPSSSIPCPLCNQNAYLVYTNRMRSYRPIRPKLVLSTIEEEKDPQDLWQGPQTPRPDPQTSRSAPQAPSWASTHWPDPLTTTPCSSEELIEIQNYVQEVLSTARKRHTAGEGSQEWIRRNGFAGVWFTKAENSVMSPLSN